MSKPREFWISNEGSFKIWSKHPIERSETNGAVRVVDAESYDSLMAEAEKLSSTLFAISDADLEACVMPKVVMYGINKALKDWQAFKDKLK